MDEIGTIGDIGEADEEQTLIAETVELLRRQNDVQRRVQNYLESFTQKLFAALEEVINDLIAAGAPGVSPAKRISYPNGRICLQLTFGDLKIIFVPLNGAARPNARDEARIHSVKFKELCSRIAVFMGDSPDQEAFYDFLIFGDGSWFAWGYGWPLQQDDYEATNFRDVAEVLVHSFVKDIHSTWQTRDETLLAPAMDPKRRVFTFGLPGEE